jgi:hypothetical protein
LRGALGLRFQGQCHKALDRRVADPARRPAARRIRQALDPMGQEALSPGDDVLAADAEPRGNAGVGGLRIGAGQHDARAHGHILARAAAAQKAEKGLALRLAQDKRDRLRAGRHGNLPKRTASS